MRYKLKEFKKTDPERGPNSNKIYKLQQDSIAYALTFMLELIKILCYD